MIDSDSNVQTIQAIYAAFGRADLPAILEHCAADAVFGFEGASQQVPWHGPWRSHGEIARFFATIAEGVQFERFEPRRFLAGENEVAVLVHLRYQVRATGKLVDQLQVHWWSLQAGQVQALTHHEDTAQVIAAVRA